MKFRIFLPLLLALFAVALPAVASDDGDVGDAGGYGVMRGGPGRGAGRDMAPDERRKMRQQMREHWRQGHPPRADGEPRWRDMSPDERREMRRQMREHRGHFDGDGRRGGCRQ